MQNRINTLTWIACAFALLWLLLAASGALAARLVCDPPPADQQVTHYNVYQDGVMIGTYQDETLDYDLSAVTPGAYNWTAEACNVWGCSSISNPYISPSGAGVPSNIRMEP